MSLNKIRRRLEALSTRIGTAARRGEPPADYPPADLTGRALADWVRNTPPGPPDWLPEASIIRSKLAATYIDAFLAAEDRIPDRKIARLAAERALHDHEADLRNGIDVRRPVLYWDGPHDEEDVYDPEGIDRLLASIGFSLPSAQPTSQSGAPVCQD
jgi:hypothetical protein